MFDTIVKNAAPLLLSGELDNDVDAIISDPHLCDSLFRSQDIRLQRPVPWHTFGAV